MADDDQDLPLYAMSAPYRGIPTKDKEGNPIRVHVFHVIGVDIERIKEFYMRVYERELSDEGALILQRGGMLKIEYDGD